MDVIKIDLSCIKSREELHGALKQDLHFPDYYGNNLDALADCLTDIGIKTYIVFSGYEEFYESCGDYAERFRRTVLRAEKEDPFLTVCFI